MRAIRITIGLLLIAFTASAQDLASFEKRTTVRKLDNGLTLIVLERHEAPVFSYATVVNAGNAQEVPGITGLAHMFEHMAFKGTDRIGTTDINAERAALAQVEQAYAAYDAERRKPVGRDDKKVAELEKAWKDAIDAAEKYVVPNEFSKIIDRAGGTGVNAFTASDETAYFFSMPSNRFELWAYLESERFLHPVFREFYKERDVVTEERRMSTESSPIGRLLEQFLETAYRAHPYRQPGVGWPSDLAAFSGAKNVVTCASGTDALLMVLMAKGVSRGDAVLCPSFTFCATGEVVALTGATPVFVDVDESTFNMDAASLKRGIATARKAGLKGDTLAHDVAAKLKALHPDWTISDRAAEAESRYMDQEYLGTKMRPIPQPE